MADDLVQEELQRHSHRVDAAVLRFTAELDRVIAKAQVILTRRLLKLLKIDADGKISPTLANQQVLRRVPLLWQNALDKAGLEQVIDDYLQSFPQQIPQFMEVLQATNHEAANPLPLPDFTKQDLAYFHSLQLSSGADIASVVEAAGQGTLTRSLFSLGGISLSQLVEAITKSVDVTASKAVSLAETSLMAFYRSVADAGYQKVEKALGRGLTYLYLGPLDKVTRPFCVRLLTGHKDLFTRAEIDKMNNGQTGPGSVFHFCGGWRCRHSWNLSLEPLPS